ncbi:hypothetical protein BpHYR1_023281 [Brachionus plicatilis]|uniref:Uncharacterized protein n=1 Tax=Brachionus plicatilis TaxID=10195 RepID=A0A3M7PS48_BRAPC|nr:hypothetical protein BpHYR1_023281 [Brachionus plicatilis]
MNNNSSIYIFFLNNLIRNELKTYNLVRDIQDVIVQKFEMSKREAALKALEALGNTDDTQSIASDDDDADFLDEFDEVDADVDEKEIFFLKKKWMIQTNISLILLKVQSIGKKINFNEKAVPTSYATRNIDNTKLSSFMMITWYCMKDGGANNA